MIRSASSPLRLPPSAFARVQAPQFLLSLTILTSLGCWSKVEYESTDKPSASTPAAVAPSESNPPKKSAPGLTDPLRAAETEGTPLPAESSISNPSDLPADPTDSKPPLVDLSADELFGDPMPPADPAITASEPPQSDPAPSAHPEEELPTDPPAATTSDSPVGGRYAMPPESPPPPATFDQEDTTPSTTPAMGERYATEPVPANTDLPPQTDFPVDSPTPESKPPVDQEPVVPFPWEAAAEPAPTATPNSQEKPTTEEVPPIFSEPPAAIAPPATTDAAPSISPKSSDGPNSPNQLAWLLGSKWSLWLLSQHAGAPADEQTQLLQESEKLAKMLGVELPQTPPFTASKPTAAFLETILPAGRELGIAIGTQHGTEELALFEVATKSNLLLVLGESRPDLIPAVVRAVTDAAKRANLPTDAVQTYSTALSGQPSLEQIDNAVFQFHRAVEESLRTPSK